MKNEAKQMWFERRVRSAWELWRELESEDWKNESDPMAMVRALMKGRTLDNVVALALALARIIEILEANPTLLDPAVSKRLHHNLGEEKTRWLQEVLDRYNDGGNLSARRAVRPKKQPKEEEVAHE